MRIEEQQHGAVTVLRPQGPLGSGETDDFSQAAHRAADQAMGRFVVDASEVPFVDSAGLEALVDLADELASAGMALKLCGVNDTLREVFELTEVTDRFEHFEDVRMAVRSFQ